MQPEPAPRMEKNVESRGGVSTKGGKTLIFWKHFAMIVQICGPRAVGRGGKGRVSGFFAARRTGYDAVTLIANSIGAFFSMSALEERDVDRAYLISPVVDMEKLIGSMMQWANITEGELEEKREIETDFGERLYWDYLCYVREHPIRWRVSTRILYGETDNMTSRETIAAFAARTGAALTVMPGGEHWFHTEEQMRFLDDWIKAAEK